MVADTSGVEHTESFIIIITIRFPNHVSSDDPLNCGDASCLTRCHRAFVSNSCHFFRTPLSIPRRHIQSLRDADQPVRRVPSRDGAIPHRSSRTVQRRWKMKNPEHSASGITDRGYSLSSMTLASWSPGGAAVRGASCCRSGTRSTSPRSTDRRLRTRPTEARLAVAHKLKVVHLHGKVAN